MAAPIQNPAKSEVCSVIRFLNAKGERLVSGLHCDGYETFPLVSSPKETSRWENFDDDDEVQEDVMTWFKGLAADFCNSGIQKLVPKVNKCLDNAGEYVEK